MFFMTRLLIFLANLYILTYVYLLELNKCGCSKDWRRDFIFYYSMIHIFIVICFVLLPDLFYQNIVVTICLKSIMGILLVVNIYCLYTYADTLEKTKCECSEDYARDFMKIFSYFYGLVIVLVFIYLLHYYMSKEYKNIKKLRFGKKTLTNNNLERIVIVNKV